MKKVIVVMAVIISTIRVNAQTFEEWFKQKETQIKYLLEQIGALKAYGEIVNKGYGIAQHGLGNIFSSKDGEYRQHYHYFLSLWKVKPGVKDYYKAVAIFKIKGNIEKLSQELNFSLNKFLSTSEKDYINTVFRNLVSACNLLTDELEMVINNDQLQLKDDERIQRIDKIYSEMLDHYEFSQSFMAQIKLLVVSRLKEKNEFNNLSIQFGLK